MSATRRKPGGKSKSLDVVHRLQQRVAEGDYYEALQLYKTSYSRLKANGKLDDAEELLTTGAIAMSQENEVWASDTVVRVGRGECCEYFCLDYARKVPYRFP